MAAKWSQTDIEYLKTNYGKIPMNELSEKLGRNKGAIIQYCHKHNISAGRYWTKEENEYFERYVGKIPLQTMARKLNKPYRALLDKNTRLGYGRFYEATDTSLHCNLI